MRVYIYIFFLKLPLQSTRLTHKHTDRYNNERIGFGGSRKTSKQKIEKRDRED